MVGPNPGIRFPKDDGESVNARKVTRGNAPKKDFEKVLSRERDGEKEENKPAKAVDEKKFNEAEKKVKDSGIIAKGPKDAKKAPSLFDLSGGESHVDAAEPTASEKEAPGGIFGEIAKSKEERVEFTPERTDIAAVNPLAQGPAQVTGASLQENRPVEGASRILDIVAKVIDKLTTVTTKGESETVISLDNIKGFEKARVTISEFDQAKGELNIKFENLTQEMKNLLDANQGSLRAGLENKGFVVQMFTATTADEVNPLVAEAERRANATNPDAEQEQREQQQEEDEKKK